MDDIYASLDAILDSVDADPGAFMEEHDEAAMTDLFFSIGTMMASECGPGEQVDAFSDFILFLSNQRAEREPLTDALIAGLLEGSCVDSPVELTLPAQAVCISIGN